MASVDFTNLPPNVSRDVFHDTIAKFLDLTRGQQPFIVDLELPDKTSLNLKNKDGTGSIRFQDDTLLQKFLTKVCSPTTETKRVDRLPTPKIQTESIMFKSETVKFAYENPDPANPPLLVNTCGISSQDKAEHTPHAAPRIKVVKSHTSPAKPSVPVMNLHKPARWRRPERTRARSGNPRQDRKMQHSLSELGQQARLKRVQFGVLRNLDFSVEYTRDLLETAGYLSFDDDERTLRIIVGGTHQVGDSLVPSIAIAIQTINYFALGNDGEADFMFLELLQHPRFEQADQFRPTTGDSKKDAHHSRTRLSELDELHGLVAPYASRWIKISFHDDGFIPDEELFRKAGLPLPVIDPELTFDDKRLAYSPQNIKLLQEWLQGGSLPWEVAFQCEALLRNGILIPTEVLMLQSQIELLAKESPSLACDALISLRTDLEGAGAPKRLSKFDDEAIIAIFENHVSEGKKDPFGSRLWQRSSKSNFICHHVKVTPTAVFFTGPFVEQSNRVIRRYPGFDSHFILVRFTDEGDRRSRLEFEVDTHSFSREWIGKFLKQEGIVIGGRHFTLLGYSQSGMRGSACFFSSEFVFEGSTVTPASIRSSLGDFAKVIDCPARYGARMSQAFSATDPSVVLHKSVIKPIIDIKTEKGDYEFSDGCGSISRELAKKVWESMLEQMPRTRRRQRHMDEPIPCAFQIRIGGSKGMVRMDPKLPGDQLCLRPSMTKFEAPGEFALEIARAFERPSDCFLNRPLIMLLWTNGVHSSVFEKMMADTLESTVSGMRTFTGVARLFIDNKLGRSFQVANTFSKLSQLQLELDQPGVLTVGLHRLMNTGLYHIKANLKHKARIPVPDSYTLVGVCDEDNYLKPRQIYACVQRYDHKTGKIDRLYFKGRLLVTRSPYIHPGDAQILYGIGAPPPDSPFAGEGNHLPNCVVFSTQGHRPVPNMLGGGDLDGDLFNVIPLPELIPPHKYMPADYPPAVLKKIGRESTIDDVADFMIDFICNDAVAAIAVNHLIIASDSNLRARDTNCIINADVLGELFRAVKLPPGDPTREAVEAPQVPVTIQKLLASHVAKYAAEIKDTYLKAAPWIQALFTRYISELGHICASHTVSNESSERVSEFEVMLGTNLEVIRDGGDLIERMKRLTGELASFVRSELEGNEGDNPHDWLARSWAAYLHTSSLGDQKFGAFSFSWIALGSVLDALSKLDERFLPDNGRIVSPFPATTASSELIHPDLDDFAPDDLDNWTWDDDVTAKYKRIGTSNARKFPHKTIVLHHVADMPPDCKLQSHLEAGATVPAPMATDDIIREAMDARRVTGIPIAEVAKEARPISRRCIK
ncbi:hypothetical protein FRC06_004696 [Ceratobasidium sp. 370]|nr:hypothetical protein FRC06_004696 [Ceratobasidium sp. 370]